MKALNEAKRERDAQTITNRRKKCDDNLVDDDDEENEGRNLINCRILKRNITFFFFLLFNKK